MFESQLAEEIEIQSLQFNGTAPSTLMRISRLSSPEPRRSLGATVTRFERPIRQAVRELAFESKVNSEAFSSIFDCTIYGQNATREPDAIRLAWFVVNAALTNAFALKRSKVSSFKEALEWFTNDLKLVEALLSCISSQDLERAESALSKLHVDDDLLDLLPYVIEPHGHVTRNSIETCDIARKTRSLKRDTGVYYTPSDIADFMVSGLFNRDEPRGTWIDPACGAGVFLRSILRLLFQQDEFSSKNPLAAARMLVFGIDKSALATDLASSVMLVECILAAPISETPIQAWKQIKANVACMDALCLAPPEKQHELCFGALELTALDSIFPVIGKTGFDHVVMNPPYSSVRIDSSIRAAWDSFSDIQPNQFADAHLAFTEMLWRLTSESGSAAAVLPLSIAANTTKSYKNLREGLIESRGLKEFLFFDREPQSLFGEDIKTRNLIVFRRQKHQTVWGLKTSRLLKWTGKQRATIFTKDRTVNVDPSQCIGFIPKLGTNVESTAYRAFKSIAFSTSAARLAPQYRRMLLQEAVESGPDLKSRTVFVSATAYNFVNAFFADGLPISPPKPYSTSPTNALVFDSSSCAFAGFAILSSRVCFWMWHVEGDGFHLTTDFLKRLPLWSALESQVTRGKLEKLGSQLWSLAAEEITGSVNGGKQTYSFHCGFDHPLVMEIEQVLIDCFRLDVDSSAFLDEFIDATISIDGTRRGRSAFGEKNKAV